MVSTGALFRKVWDSIADRGLDLLRRAAGTVPLESLCRELLFERGEASGIALAREIAERYRGLKGSAQEAFFLALLKPAFLPDPKSVLAAAEKYRSKQDSQTLGALFAAAEPLRQELFRRINLAPGGTAVLVQMREDLLRLLPNRPALKPVDMDLRHLLASWFNRGFLRLERIDWHTPAVILEKLIQHEAVHEIRGWDDLRRRLASDRRCFAFFHPALPDEPLIFVEVALTRGLVSSLPPLLAGDGSPLTPLEADTAIFYSISNCLGGLRGISFGNFLIKQVVAELEAEDLKLGLFATLSPAPGFRKWFLGLTAGRKAELAGGYDLSALNTLEETQWFRNRAACERLRPLLLRLCAHYLLQERDEGRAVDPVAAFHLGNGASVEQINWLADPSEKGLTQSFGLMVNYAYRPSQIERNHEAYVKRSRIAASAQVKAMLDERTSASASKS
jgi:malonyl-CoA decarboxylase